MNHGMGWRDVQIDVLALGDGAELLSAAPADPQPQGDVSE
jgi:hypothetical protein